MSFNNMSCVIKWISTKTIIVFCSTCYFPTHVSYRHLLMNYAFFPFYPLWKIISMKVPASVICSRLKLTWVTKDRISVSLWSFSGRFDRISHDTKPCEHHFYIVVEKTSAQVESAPISQEGKIDLKCIIVSLLHFVISLFGRTRAFKAI